MFEIEFLPGYGLWKSTIVRWSKGKAVLLGKCFLPVWLLFFQSRCWLTSCRVTYLRLRDPWYNSPLPLLMIWVRTYLIRQWHLLLVPSLNLPDHSTIGRSQERASLMLVGLLSNASYTISQPPWWLPLVSSGKVSTSIVTIVNWFSLLASHESLGAKVIMEHIHPFTIRFCHCP